MTLVDAQKWLNWLSAPMTSLLRSSFFDNLRFGKDLSINGHVHKGQARKRQFTILIKVKH